MSPNDWNEEIKNIQLLCHRIKSYKEQKEQENDYISQSQKFKNKHKKISIYNKKKKWLSNM